MWSERLSRRRHRHPQPGVARSRASAGRRCSPRVEELEPRLVLTTQLFTVPGAAQAQTDLTFSWQVREALFDNEIGVYVVEDQAGRVGGLLPTDPGYAQAALQSAQILFPSGRGETAVSNLTFTAGGLLAFYLVQDDTTANALAGNPQDSATGRPVVFFSVDGINPDDLDHVRQRGLGDRTVQFAFEDLTGLGDRDFNDVVLTIGIARERASVVPGQAGQTTTATFTALSKETAFNDEVGLFVTADATGRIGSLNPGDSGYAQAALSSASRQVLLAAGQGAGTTSTANLPGGAFFGLYLVANGTADEALANNPSNDGSSQPVVFFGFPGANPDGVDHLRWLSDTDFGFEDLQGGGDRDFNDLVGRIEFGPPQGEPTPEEDTAPPIITAHLANDTGSSATDGITSDPSIRGTVTDTGTVASFRAGFNDTPDAQFVDILSALQPDGSFVLNRARLEQVNGGPLADGPHTLHLQAGDDAGNTATVFDVAFTLDTTAPREPAFALDAASDTGTAGDDRTDLATATLVGTTAPNTSVQLVQTGVIVVSDASGSFTFADVNLAPGANTFTVRATDTAGNASQANRTVTRTTNSAPVVRAPAANVTLAQGASTLVDLAGIFDDPDITNSVVRADTSAGPINIELFDRDAPRTVANFLNYVTDNDYANSIFHRSAKLQNGTPFVLQGGGFTFQENPAHLETIPTDPAVQNEPDPVNRSNVRGTVALAKLGNNPNSATDQFFFNLGNNAANLDNQNGGFTVFGRVVGPADQAVVDALAAIPTQDQGAAPALPPSQQGTFTEIPLQNYNGSNFPTDTTRDNYALVNNLTVVSRTEELTYAVVGNTNPGVVTATVGDNRVTLQAGNQGGTTTITVRATDRSGASVDTTFQVTVP